MTGVQTCALPILGSGVRAKGDVGGFSIVEINGNKKRISTIEAENLIHETKFDKLPAKQWIEKFARGEEAKWTGLNEWLAQQQGSVSKADIQKYLKDNRIQVVEVVKGNELGEQDYQQQLDELYAEQKRIELEAKPYTDNGIVTGKQIGRAHV